MLFLPIAVFKFLSRHGKIKTFRKKVSPLVRIGVLGLLPYVFSFPSLSSAQTAALAASQYSTDLFQTETQSQQDTQQRTGPDMQKERIPVQEETTSDEDLLHRKYLFGNWGGQRSRLEQKGVSFDFYYIADVLGNKGAGREDLGAWGRIRGTMDVDFSKFSRWKGLTFHMTGLWQYGTDLSKQYVSTLVNASSLPSAHTLRGDSFFFQQHLLHNKLALRVGQIAGYDSYGASEYGSSFINLALGYAHSNLNQSTYLSFNPAGVPSFEVKVLPTHRFYVKAMVQSEEREPYKIDPSGFNLHFGGPVVATEVGFLHHPPKAPEATATMGPQPYLHDKETGNYPGVYKFGSVYNPHNFKDPRTLKTAPGNYLLYAQADQAVYRMGRSEEGKDRGLDLTFSQSYAPGDVTEHSLQTMAGARWIGLWGGRWKKDSLAVGYVRTSVGSHYKEQQKLSAGRSLSTEHLVELNYKTNITPWWMIQPVAEFFIKPGGEARRDPAYVLGFRTKLTF